MFWQCLSYLFLTIAVLLLMIEALICRILSSRIDSTIYTFRKHSLYPRRSATHYFFPTLPQGLEGSGSNSTQYTSREKQYHLQAAHRIATWILYIAFFLGCRQSLLALRDSFRYTAVTRLLSCTSLTVPYFLTIISKSRHTHTPVF